MCSPSIASLRVSWLGVTTWTQQRAGAPGWGARSLINTCPAPRSFARVTVTVLLDLLQDLIEVVARRILHGRERLVGLELLQPQHLADGQDVPVVDVRATRGVKCAAVADYGLRVGADSRLEGITLDVGDLGPVKGCGPHQPAGRAVADHRVIELPVLPPYR